MDAAVGVEHPERDDFEGLDPGFFEALPSGSGLDGFTVLGDSTGEVPSTGQPRVSRPTPEDEHLTFSKQ